MAEATLRFGPQVVACEAFRHDRPHGNIAADIFGRGSVVNSPISCRVRLAPGGAAGDEE
jgi:hypothetical protein